MKKSEHFADVIYGSPPTATISHPNRLSLSIADSRFRRRPQFCLLRIRAKNGAIIYSQTSKYSRVLFGVSAKTLGENSPNPRAQFRGLVLRERSQRDRKQACCRGSERAPHPYPIAHIIWLLFTRRFFVVCESLSTSIHPSRRDVAPKPQKFGYSKCRLITCFAAALCPPRSRRDYDDAKSHSSPVTFSLLEKGTSIRIAHPSFS